MKNKIKILINLSFVVIIFTSCKKTYECRDINNRAVGQVEARNLKKAKELCPMHSIVVLNDD
jgi:hypothetical protein